MKIIYKNKKAEKQFSSEYYYLWKYPDPVKEKLMATENYIRSAGSLRDVVNYSPFRFHHLKGNRKNEWSIYLGNTGYRLTVIPCDDDGKTITEGDIISFSTSIRIILVTEVSNHYE